MALRGTTTSAKGLYLFGAAVLLLGGVLLLNWLRQTRPFIKATSHQPERYTELYFTNSNNLPSAAQSGRPLSVSFAIHNVEARTMTYTYETDFIAPPGQTTVLSRRQLSLSNGRTKTITEATTLPPFSGRAEITVVLLNQPEAIHFWLVSTP